jgi:hypothetical protein
MYQQQPAEQQAAVSAPADDAPASQEPPAFLEGAKDRDTWERWFAGLNGDAKAGADFWAARRNDPRWRGQANCAVGEGGEISDEFRITCEKAQAFLAVVDRRRTTERDYKRGWNHI